MKTIASQRIGVAGTAWPGMGGNLTSSRTSGRMHTGLHAVGWGLQRLAIALGIVVLAAILAYISWVFIIVAGQALSALAQ